MSADSASAEVEVEADAEASADAEAPATASTSDSAFWKSIHRAQAALTSLSLILGTVPEPVSYSDNPALSLLHDADVNDRITRRLRMNGSGAGDDGLCRWLYDTFQSADPDLQLVALKFLPTLAGVYLSRAISRQPLAGFEAVLLAFYAHETTARGGQPITISIPSMSCPSMYHEGKTTAAKNKALVEPEAAVLSPALEPHGAVRSTKRARIVGVALELYYSKIASIPLSSKLEFCKFCIAWSGQGRLLLMLEETKEKDSEKKEEEMKEEEEEKGKRIPLPWELMQPIIRIVGHCLLGPTSTEELKEAASGAAKCLHARAMHDMNPHAILASRSLLNLGNMEADDVVWETLPSSPAANTNGATVTSDTNNNGSSADIEA